MPVAIVGEYYTAFEDKHLIKTENLQHIVMYTFFCISGLMQLLEFYEFSFFPPMCSILYSFAFLIESFLMFYHLHVGQPVERCMHVFLALTSFVCGMSCFLEHIHPSSLLAHLGRPALCMQQGAWFYYIAFYSHFPSNTSGSLWQQILNLFKDHHHHSHTLHLRISQHFFHQMNQSKFQFEQIPSSERELVESDRIMMLCAHFGALFAFDLVLIFTIAMISRHFNENDTNHKKINKKKHHVYYAPLSDDV